MSSIEIFVETSENVKSIQELLTTLKEEGVELDREEGLLAKWCDEMEKGLDSLSIIIASVRWNLLHQGKNITGKDLLDEPQKAANDLIGATTCTSMYILDLQAILQDIVANP